MEKEEKNSFLNKKNIEAAEKEKNTFPTEVFPEHIEKYIEQACSRRGFHKSYSSLAILTAIGTAIGGNKVMKIDEKWQVSANLWGLIIGNPAEAKTHALRLPFSILRDKERIYFKDYNEKLKQYNLLQEKEKTNNNEQIEKPIQKQILIQDITIEKLAIVLNENELHGVCSLQDEMAGFFVNLDQYKSNTRNKYLETWSRGDWNVGRVGRESLNVQNIFLTLIGTIPFEAYIKFKRNDSTADGFSDRFLIALPENNEFLKTTPEGVDFKLLNELDDLIEKFFNKRRNLKEIIDTEESFKVEYFNWKNIIGEESFNTNDNIKKSIIGKLTEYVLRFSILFFFLDNDHEKVNISHLNKAIKLFHYFKYTAFKISDMVENIDPLGNLPKTDKKLLKELPGEFKTADAIALFIKLGVDSNKAKNVYNRLLRFLIKNDLVEKISQGVYGRLYD